jgi:methionyl-tRNA formyltransferase
LAFSAAGFVISFGVAGLKVLFMGTAEFSCASLSRLLQARHLSVMGVVTQPDRPKGRDLKVQPSPVKLLALSAGKRVFQPERARDHEFVQELVALEPELIIVAAYGQILPKAILDLPRFGCINVHTSLLPKYRGAAPIQWAILNDEPHTGVTIMRMDAGLDTGGIICQETTPILPEDTAESLHDRLAEIGADLLLRTIPPYVSGELKPWPQPAEGVNYAPKIKKQDGQIDWTETARAIWNRVRALMPWPGAYTFFPGKGVPELIKIWQAQVAEQTGAPGQVLLANNSGIVVGCGRQSLRITQLQREGGRRLDSAQFLAGCALSTGAILGRELT